VTIDSLLAGAGSDTTKPLSANVWLSNMADFAEMNSVWDAWVSPGNPPARACVESRLALSKYLVEIMVIAAVD
jgi:enamine deaminase RidA (YjgF/YER057c/UK114 family)